MKPSELVAKLKPFCKADPAEEPEVLCFASDQIMPVVADTARIWKVNGTAYLLIFRDPNKPKR